MARTRATIGFNGDKLAEESFLRLRSSVEEFVSRMRLALQFVDEGYQGSASESESIRAKRDSHRSHDIAIKSPRIPRRGLVVLA